MGHSNRSGHLLMEPKQLLTVSRHSLDLNSVDFAIRSVLENEPSRTSYNNLDSLNMAVVKS
uniref:Uncharacterized protein n=1 Tax=Heterorhabditis bacteriophora TaxID=37862 RepID=A0A1I7WPY8_HETBA